MSKRLLTPIPVLAIVLAFGAPIAAAQEGSPAKRQETDEKGKPASQLLVPELIGRQPADRPERALRSGRTAGPDLPAIPAPDDVGGPPEGAARSGSGLAWRILAPGEGGEHPGPNDEVTVRYTGWTTDGEMFDTTEAEGAPRTFAVNRVIAGFGEALQSMAPRERRRIWVPEELAYAGKPGRPQGMLVFDIELVSFVRAPAPPPDLAAAPAEAVTTASGLAYRVLRSAEGARPARDDVVVVQVEAWTPVGELRDSSTLRGEPASFRLDLTIPAFAELLPRMAVGERWQIWSPAEMARLDEDSIVDSPLVFVVELLEVLKRPEMPADVSLPPRDAERTITGLAYRVLRPGTGTEHPRFGDTVEVHYAGWTTDGKMFDSSFDHGRPGRFVLDGSKPKGWNEALSMMVVGEKRRIWIPEELAYAGEKNRPRGMLVFDVELLSLERAD